MGHPDFPRVEATSGDWTDLGCLLYGTPLKWICFFFWGLFKPNQKDVPLPNKNSEQMPNWDPVRLVSHFNTTNQKGGTSQKRAHLTGGFPFGFLLDQPLNGRQPEAHPPPIRGFADSMDSREVELGHALFKQYTPKGGPTKVHGPCFFGSGRGSRIWEVFPFSSLYVSSVFFWEVIHRVQ